MNWTRVTRSTPCPICHKPDWCCIGDKGINCMRVESMHSVHNGGWFHPFEEGSPAPRPVSRIKAMRTCALDTGELLRRWSGNFQMDNLATELGVSVDSLLALGTRWAPEYHAHAFPMWISGKVVGIRLRNAEKKWAVKGSHSGLFIPFSAIGRLSPKTVMVCEGPTDTAAALDLGFFAIGRPSRLGHENDVDEILKEIGTKEAIVCVDNDERINKQGKREAPGQQGAQKLAEAISCRVVMYTPPAKDLRQFLVNGGSHALLESSFRDCVRI